MHVLGHSFSQKCKRSKRPRDLHIRKVSFSGSSLSGCSLSSSDSTASACTAIRPHYAEHAPARLHERAFKDSPSPRMTRFEPTTFYNDDIDADEAVDDEDEDSGDDDDENLPHFTMELPPHAGNDEEHTGHDRYEPTDYFAIQLAQRPPMPRSRWSESTIQSVQTIDAIPTPGSIVSTAATEQGEDQGPPVKVEMPPNFSYKRAASTPGATVNPPTPGRRPPMKTMDAIDEFVKRGGWKRKGVVFQQEEVDTNEGGLSQ